MDGRDLMKITMQEYRTELLFRTSFKAEMNKKPFPWNSLTQYLEYFIRNILTNENFPCNRMEYVGLLTKILKSDTCESASLFTAITDLIIAIRWKDEGYESIFGCFKWQHLEEIIFNLIKKDAEGIFPYEECIPVVNALCAGDDELMQVLAIYGCYANISKDCFFARRQAWFKMERFKEIIYQRKVRSLETCFFSLDPDAYTGVASPVRFCLDASCQPINISFKRLFFVSLGIDVLFLKVKNNAYFQGCIKSMEIYFETVTEPYPTVAEVRTIFDDCMLDDDEKHLLGGFCKDFEDAIPFCTKKYEPRTLSHLSRCQLRKNCSRKELTLPAIIDKLHLPKKIKNFILCKPTEK